VAETPLAGLLARAFEARRAFFPPRVEFVYPRLTLPVRSTGADCPLNCAHCRGRYLRGMLPLQAVLGRPPGPERSFLVSGASDLKGRVPHRERLEELRELARRGPLNLHTGLVAGEEAEVLGKMAGVVSLDFLVDGETIKEVYGLKATGEDFIRAYRALRRHTRVVPHLCVGLYRGRLRGEAEALEALQREGVDALSFLVFRPTPGTPLASCPPPPLEEVASLLARARLLFPRTPLNLGCMRPGGRYRAELDCLALRAGLNALVQPTPPARRLAADLGLTITRKEECCSL
jgi:lipoyl synthase